ncbi:MAG: tetratricopeptide repeat protein, partial [Terracidiphilus sp.]
MRRLMMMVAAMSLLIGAAQYGRASSASDADKKDKMEAARLAEEKGDLARIRNDYAGAAVYFQAALHISRQDAPLYNKLGIVELKLGERGQARKDFGRALKYDPRFTSALNNLGAVA